VKNWPSHFCTRCVSQGAQQDATAALAYMPDEGTVFVLETHAKAAAGAHLVCGASASSVILLPSNFVHIRGIQDAAKKLQLPGINLPLPAIVAAALSMHRAAQLDESCEGELRHVMSKLDLVHAQVRNRKRIRQNGRFRTSHASKPSGSHADTWRRGMRCAHSAPSR
jgi:hypothetical protein